MFVNNNESITVLNNYNKKNILHKVAYGETIEEIAKLYNNSKEKIRKVNNLMGEIEEGNILLISEKNIAIYVVKPLDTFASIAKKFEVSVMHLKQLNKTEHLFIGQRLII